MELGIQKGKWKYLDHKGSDSNFYKPGLKKFHNMGEYLIPDNARKTLGLLYNLEVDPGETKNLYKKHPEVVKELKALLDTLRQKP
ncbi:MAG: hypothetical protein MK132_27240 [Lentisphaerales bacterium]|nr:hypothetical protein [Lentisphaerales bacterium]